MAKLIYAKTKAGFEIAFADRTITGPVYKSVVFTEDGYLWTHGNYFRIFADSNPFDISYVNNIASITDKDAKVLTILDLGIIAVNAIVPIVAATTNGIVALTHSDSSLGAANSYGAISASADTIIVPKIFVDIKGHVITGTTSYIATLNQVKTTVVNNVANYYLTFSSSNTSGTAELYKSTGIYINPSSNTIYASDFLVGGTSISGLYAPIVHASAAATYGLGTAGNYGHLKLSDSIIDSISNTGSGTAATPKAVYDSIVASKIYTDALIGANDAMVFAGTVNGIGVIQSHNSSSVKQAIIDGTTNLSGLTAYSAGWTWKVTSIGTIAGIGTVEINDMVISSKDFSGAYAATDWIIIQGNINGAVISSSALTTNQLVVGSDGSQGIKTLPGGTNGTLLKMVAGTPQWAVDSNSWRPVQLAGVQKLATGDGFSLNFEQGNGITLGWNGTTNAVTVAYNGTGLGSVSQSLNIKSGGIALGLYDPTAVAGTNNTIDFIGGLTGTLNSNIFSIKHTNTAITAGAQKLYSVSYDTYGHITGSTEVVSLKNPTALSFADSGGIDLIYDGSVAQTVKFMGGTDISISGTAVSNILTYTLGITNRYRALNYLPTFGGSSTAMYNDITSTALTFAPGNSNITMGFAGNILTISSINTWRNITACTAASPLTALTIGAIDLKFAPEFIFDSVGADIHLGWAEVDNSGTIINTF